MSFNEHFNITGRLFVYNVDRTSSERSLLAGILCLIYLFTYLVVCMLCLICLLIFPLALDFIQIF